MPKGRRKVTREMMELMRHVRKEGSSAEKIAGKLNLTTTTVRRYLKRGPR